MPQVRRVAGEASLFNPLRAPQIPRWPAGPRCSTCCARARGCARLESVVVVLNLRRACRRSCGRPAGVGSSTCGARAAGPCEWPARPRFQPEARVPQVPRRAGGMFVLQPVARAPEVARGWRPSVVPQVPRVACWVPILNLRRACRRSRGWPAGIRFQPEARVPQVRRVAGGDSISNLRRACRRSGRWPAGDSFPT